MKKLLLKFTSYLLLTVGMISCHVETPDPVIVDFSGVADKGKVSFVNNTTGADSYVWDFDDGEKSTDKEPVHTYAASKTYNVKLVATNEAGSQGKTVPIVVNIAVAAPAPVASFTYTGGNCTAPCSVTFINKSTSATTYEWDFANDIKSVNFDPGSILYSAAGTYTVSLKATGPGGANTTSQTVTINAAVAVAKPVIEKIWDKSYGGSGSDKIAAGVKTDDGGVVFVGSTTTNSKGFTDILVFKVDADGNTVWSKTYGGPGVEEATCIYKLNDAYLIGGFTSTDGSGASGFNSKPSGVYDFWFLRLQLDGNLIWEYTYGARGFEFLKSIIQTSDGGFLLAGSAGGGLSRTKNKNGYANGRQDYWIIKTDGSGKYLWDRVYGGAEDDLMTSMMQHDNTIFLSGYSKSSKTKDLGSSYGIPKQTDNIGGEDFWVVKIKEDGSYISDFTYGGTGSDRGYASGYNGRNIIAGPSDSSGGTGNKSQNRAPYLGKQDFYVKRYDDSWAETWDGTFGGTEDDIATSVGLVGSDVLIAGSSRSGKSGNKTAESYGNNDAWGVLVSNSQAKYLGDMGFGGTGDDQFTCIIDLGNNTYMLAGDSNSPKSGNKDADAKGGEDAWVVKVRINK